MFPPRRSHREGLALLAVGLAGWLCVDLGISFSVTVHGPNPQQEAGVLRPGLPHSSLNRGTSGSAWAGRSVGSLVTVLAATACAVRALVAVLARQAQAGATQNDEAVCRRLVVLPTVLAAGSAVELAPQAALAEGTDVPDRINNDPFELIGMTDVDDAKADRQEFYMKKNYMTDTYQVLKHMKISASLDKGTANMERWNKRVKEEMNDWVSLYRRQEAIVGRQSYYSLYSAVNTLASHFTSYGPKFPFPNKRRPRFYQLMNTTEKYLEKGK